MRFDPNRIRLTDDIVDGRSVDDSDVREHLGIDPSDHTVALVLRLSDDTDTPPDGYDGAGLHRFASRIPAILGCSRSTIVSADCGRVEIWASWSCSPPRSIESALADFGPIPAGLRVSVGPCASGVDGIRRSHLGACEADRIALERVWSRERRVVQYDDVAIVAMLTRDCEQARWFVVDTLGGLGRPGRVHEELRETLRVYLAFGRSRLEAAKTLYVARNTVAYRVAKAVRLLGRPIDSDPVKLRLALEIARAMPDLVDGHSNPTYEADPETTGALA